MATMNSLSTGICFQQVLIAVEAYKSVLYKNPYFYKANQNEDSFPARLNKH